MDPSWQGFWPGVWDGRVRNKDVEGVGKRMAADLDPGGQSGKRRRCRQEGGWAGPLERDDGEWAWCGE